MTPFFTERQSGPYGFKISFRKIPTKFTFLMKGKLGVRFLQNEADVVNNAGVS
jgi:hypothetical protein